MCFKSLQVLRPFLQFGILLLAIHISLTRITDHYHHPHDVVTGALAGTLTAVVMLIFYLQILDRPFVMSANSADGMQQDKKANDSNRTRIVFFPTTLFTKYWVWVPQQRGV